MNDCFKIEFESIINSSDATEWEKSFAQSVYLQASKKGLSEKQKAIWDRIAKNVMNPVKLEFKDLSEEAKMFIARTTILLGKTKDKWAIEFTNSLTSQLYKGKVLTDKQKEAFENLFDKKINKTKKG